MTIEEIKNILLDNPSLICKVLEDLDCEYISDKHVNQIRASLPMTIDGGNPTSIRIKLDNNISCTVFSRNDFQGGSIIDLIKYIKKTTLGQSIEWLCKSIGIKDDYTYIPKKVSQTYSFIKQFKNKNNSEDIVKYKILNEDSLKDFKNIEIKAWTKEGITKKIQDKYNVMFDEKRNRIVFPIRNVDGKIISIKGRWYKDNWKELGQPKYMYYTSLGTLDFLFGLNNNKQTIINKNEIILFESEKSVMKFERYSENNSVAVCTHNMAILQIKLLLSLHISNIVIAYDKDVSYKELLQEANKLNKFVNVSIIFDKTNLLDEKDSPIDKGIDIFNQLYKQRIKV